jgi:hypothetical protein
LGCIPALEVSVSWPSCFYLPLAAALGFGSAACAIKACSGVKAQQAVWLAVALVCETAGLMIFQPAAMSFWALVGMALLANRVVDVKALWIRLPGVFGAASVLDYCAIQLAKRTVLGGESYARGRLVKDIAGKAYWFVTGPLVEALNLHRIRAFPTIACFVGVFLVVGLVGWLRSSSRRVVPVLSLSLLLVPGALIPNLAVEESWPCYRILTGLSSLLIVFALYAARGWLAMLPKVVQRRGSGALALIVLSWGLIALYESALQLRAYVVEPQRREFNALEKAVAQYDTGRHASICLEPLTEGDSLAPMLQSDEFGRPSTAAPWAQAQAIAVVWSDLHRTSPLPPVAVGRCDSLDVKTLNVVLRDAVHCL